MSEHFSYKSYSWSLGTTSFRMADFHRKVEELLILLDEFWKQEKNSTLSWKSNAATQAGFYDFIFEKGFITGEIQGEPDKKAKTARQKTSGLVDIGLITADRRLTAVGEKLLRMTKAGDFSSDNEFQIPSDSFLYLKQMLKTANATEYGFIRPFLVTGKVLLSCGGYLSEEEFTYLLPLCMSDAMTEDMIENIALYRQKSKNIDDIIVETVLGRYNYPAALEFFLQAEKTPENIMTIGMNRDGIRHDKCYVELYEQLRQVYLFKEERAVPALLKAARAVKNKPGTRWRTILFTNVRRGESFADLAYNQFDEVQNEEDFDRCFFTYLHLIKIKANLSDYKDLNRRYLKITDAVLFDDGKVTFTPLFMNFFKTGAGQVFEAAFEDCQLLTQDCELTRIHEQLVFVDDDVIEVFNAENGLALEDMQGVYDYIENDRYDRFRQLIDTQFPNEVILSMLDKFETRTNDAELIELAGGAADVPTIFEYMIGIAWYRLSGYQGKILDYMNLSLDMDLLPRTHAGGGESDIVYKYTETLDYPEHTLLIECTLMEGTVQRHGEMEPVSRHLANYMIDEGEETYCAFISNNLHASVISDFRMRKSFPYYRNDTEHVDGMKIMPLHTRELKQAIKKNISYAQLYSLFDEAFWCDSIQAPPEWYQTCIKAKLEAI